MTNENIKILRLDAYEKVILDAEEKDVQVARTAMFLCEAGSVDIMLDGVSYHMVQSSLLVYFPLSTLRVTHKTFDCKGIMISGDLETIQPLLYKISDFNGLFLIRKNPLCQLNYRQEKNIKMYIELIEDLIMRRNGTVDSQNELTNQIKAIRNHQSELLGNSLMLEIVTCYTKFDPHARNMNRKEDVLLKFISSLYKNYREEHEVNYYAEQQCLTSRYFSAIIRDQSGKTPSQWIAAALLVEAKQMLRQSSKSIKQISEILHFPNQSYFGKWFKNLTGIGPLEYKNGKDVQKKEDTDFNDLVKNGKLVMQ